MEEEAAAIEKAVSDVLESGIRTADLASGGKAASTKVMTEEIKAALLDNEAILQIMGAYA
ncbi:3-isopropylmalate dehydrogenase [Mycobacteroides abscessus subsp. abscessus]|nr:3-isopropylmalate dehydrogenase [Mycobacteroides abscessus subsp. abscessus]